MRIAIILDERETLERAEMHCRERERLGGDPLDPDPGLRALAEALWLAHGAERALGGVDLYVTESAGARPVEAYAIVDAEDPDYGLPPPEAPPRPTSRLYQVEGNCCGIRLTDLLALAKRHGDVEESIYEVGDIRYIAGLCWSLLDESKRQRVAAAFREMMKECGIE